jgi:hypothetical protein
MGATTYCLLSHQSRLIVTALNTLEELEEHNSQSSNKHYITSPNTNASGFVDKSQPCLTLSVTMDPTTTGTIVLPMGQR